jgi:hypothetical protein
MAHTTASLWWWANVYFARLLDDPFFNTLDLRVLEIKFSRLKLGQAHVLKFPIPLSPVRSWRALHPGTMDSGGADPPRIAAL